MFGLLEKMVENSWPRKYQKFKVGDSLDRGRPI